LNRQKNCKLLHYKKLYAQILFLVLVSYESMSNYEFIESFGPTELCCKGTRDGVENKITGCFIKHPEWYY
jgi:hypothetical protein